MEAVGKAQLTVQTQFRCAAAQWRSAGLGPGVSRAGPLRVHCAAVLRGKPGILFKMENTMSQMVISVIIIYFLFCFVVAECVISFCIANVNLLKLLGEIWCGCVKIGWTEQRWAWAGLV